MSSGRWAVLGLLLLGCPTPITVDAGTDAGPAIADASVEIDAGPSCLALETVDLDQADAGRAFLLGAGAGGDFVPRLAFDNLWRVCGTGQPADFAAAARAWWTLATKTRVYTDGSAPQSGHRTFMATQLAFGTTQAQLEALEPSYLAMRQYLLTLQPPAWPFTAPEAGAVARGRTIFRAQCTSCHRDDRCERMASVEVAQRTVGTDAERAVKYGDNEVALINGTWFGMDEPHRATGSYVAPSLRGVWASAPYLHNGSVPTITAMLDSTQRPRFFTLRGTSRADYDEVNVGLKVEVFTAAPANPTRADRAAVYDTTKPGLGNGGHLFGDALTIEQRADVVAFLKTF